MEELFAIKKRMDDWAERKKIFTVDVTSMKREEVAESILRWHSSLEDESSVSTSS